MWKRNLFFVAVLVVGVGLFATRFFPAVLPARQNETRSAEYVTDDFRDTIRRVNEAIREGWKSDDLKPAPRADSLTVARRVSLGLTGRIPSLQEIRQFETKDDAERLNWWVDTLLADRRSADYLAERLARAFVGAEDGPFLIFRRRRFVTWLSDELIQNRAYDQIARELIAGEGLWTDKPATNFITVTAMQEQNNRPNPERLAGRVARAFLGVRIDCAQCHDHPFQNWKQADFQGLAAFFGQTKQGFSGIYDGDGEYTLEHRKTGVIETIAPRVPSQEELLPDDGSRREKLATWVTHKDNPYFARAAVNRFWALLFGRPLVDPVDDIASTENPPAAMTILAADFATHGYDVHRLLRLIASTEAFSRDSRAEHEITEVHERAWAAFPMTRLRPEQVAGGVLQAASLETISSESSLLMRFATTVSQNEFVKRYGDTGEDEFTGRGGTIPQRLLLMNGQLVHEKTKEGIFSAASRIASLAPDDRVAVETAFLAVLTRRPNDLLRERFEARLAGSVKDERARRMEDLYWALINSTEFAWNH